LKDRSWKWVLTGRNEDASCIDITLFLELLLDFVDRFYVFLNRHKARRLVAFLAMEFEVIPTNVYSDDLRAVVSQW
jgi:hypothetical protein